LLTLCDSNHLYRGSVRTMPVRHDGAWPAIARFIAGFRNFSAALRSRRFVANTSSTSPS
jgi:hypothetical protein